MAAALRRDMMTNLRFPVTIAITLAALTVAPRARAQQLPLGQAHGGRHGGASSPLGGAQTTTPLSFPPERHGLPIPITLVETGGSGLGEAGLGWSISPSYVEANTGFTRRRPRHLIPSASWTGPTPSATPRVSVTLAGARTSMIPVDGSGHYRAVVDGQTMQLSDRTGANGTWELLDGRGRKYLFAALPNADDGTHWYLTQISDGTGDHVDLKYRPVSVTDLGKSSLPGTALAIEVQLSAVQYNFDAGGCPKHSVALEWSNPLLPSGSAAPQLALWIEAGSLRLRTQVVTAISVNSHGASCGSTWNEISRYALRYAPDADKALPRLVKVDVLGRSGTPEASRALPVARYWYGSATHNNPKEPPTTVGPFYSRAADITLPSGTALGGFTAGPSWLGFLHIGITTATFEDFDGDGLPDLLGHDNWWRNTRGSGFAGAADPFAGFSGAPPFLSAHMTSSEIHGGSYGTTTHHEELAIQLIDFNGDGRVDILDAKTAPTGHWWLYLNDTTGWRKVDLDISDVRNDLMTGGHEFPSGLNLSPSRSTTGDAYDEWHCVKLDGSACDSSKLPAVNYPYGEGSQVDWKLVDVNGDGYPDLVASRFPSQAIPTPKKCNYAPPDYGAGMKAECTGSVSTHVVRPDGVLNRTELWVFYNRAGVGFGFDGVKPFSSWTRIDSSSCGVEAWGARGVPLVYANGWESGGIRYYGALPTGAGAGSEQTCGLVDLNGDGLVDQFDQGWVKLGTGTRFVGDFSAQYPGPLRRITSPSWDHCHPSQSGSYTVAQDAGYIDLDGDGIADYVDARSRTVRFGTGFGLTDPVPLQGVPADFALSTAQEYCDGSSVTMGGLFDVDGDGKLDYAHTLSTGTMQVWSMTNQNQGRGALDVGRLIEVRNGYGATQHYHYGNAKRHYAPTQSMNDSTHQLPFPEIVVDQTWITDATGSANAIAPTYSAYNGARLWFDAFADRWTFRGYERVATTSGATSTSPFYVYGAGQLVEAYRSQDLGGDYERNLLVGHARRQSTFFGDVPQDPRVWLDPAQPAEQIAGWAGQTDYTYGEIARTLGGFNAQDDCTYTPQPHGGGEQTWMFVSDGTYGDFDQRCFATSAVYPKTIVAKRGAAPAPSNSFVETRTIVGSVDVLGRPLSIEHDGDTRRSDDDVCESRTWAISDANWGVQDAVSIVRWLEPLADTSGGGTRCDGATKILAGERMLYDGFTPGTVSAGVHSGRVVERYEPATGKKLEEFLAESYFYVPGSTAVLEKAIFDVDSANNKLRVYKPTAWDAWKLVPTASFVTGTDLTLNLTSQRSYDPYTLALVEAKDANGLTARHAYDGYGRATLDTIVDPASGTENLVAAVSYLGDTQVATAPPFADPSSGPIGDTLATGGRQVFARRWHEAVAATGGVPPPTSPSRQESWMTTSFDGLGRVRQSTRPLGSDYAGKSLLADRTYDSMGRLAFESDAYSTSEVAPHYGTSYLYRADGAVQCAARGRGAQTLFGTTSPAEARYVSCATETYSGFQRMIVERGPEENDPSSASYNAYDLVVSGAARAITKQRITAAGQPTSRMDFAYDRFGRQIGLTRFANPTVASSATVAWSADLDSLGRVMRYREPGAAQRTFTFDHAGDLVSTDWQDGATAHSIRSQLDGLGRLTKSWTMTSDTSGVLQDDADSVNTYSYDASTGQPFHRDTTYVLGRMTYAHSAAQSVYLGYDSLGRSSFRAWVDSGARRVEQTMRYRFDGSALQLGYGIPDDGYAPETASWDYDSAQRTTKVHWQDDVHPTAIDLFSAVHRDERGRLREALYGNGVDEKFTYRDGDRNELMVKQLATAVGSGYELFDYDDTLRVKSRTDSATYGLQRKETATFAFDLTGRLAAASVKNNVSGTFSLDDTYAYDGLGSLTTLTDKVGTRGFTTAADATDPDRLCRVVGAGITASSGCNFQYDALGNVTSSPLTGSVRRAIAYDGRGRPSEISLTNTFLGMNAAYKYDPFDGVAQLDVVGITSDGRQDVRYGDGVELSVFKGSNSPTFERRVPLPSGAAFVKRGFGSAATLLYSLGDPHGARVVTDGGGKVTQETVYRPYGDERIRTGTVGAQSSWKYLYNGGDALDDLMIVQVGARLYEPRFGRFLQRDPLVAFGSASLAHPYMFAGGDPVSRVDPSGMAPDACKGDECKGSDINPITTTIAGIGWLADHIGGLFGGGSSAPDISWKDAMRRDPRTAGTMHAVDTMRAANPWGDDVDEDAEDFRRGVDEMMHSSPLDNGYVHAVAQYAFPLATLGLDILEGRGGPSIDLDKLAKGDQAEMQKADDFFATARGVPELAPEGEVDQTRATDRSSGRSQYDPRVKIGGSGRAIEAHGVFPAGGGLVAIPENTTLTMAAPGISVDEFAARRIAVGDWAGALKIQPELNPTTYVPGDLIPNFRLSPLRGGHMVRMENIIVGRRMTLRDILAPDMGSLDFAVCTKMRPPPGW